MSPESASIRHAGNPFLHWRSVQTRVLCERVASTPGSCALETRRQMDCYRTFPGRTSAHSFDYGTVGDCSSTNEFRTLNITTHHRSIERKHVLNQIRDVSSHLF